MTNWHPRVNLSFAPSNEQRLRQRSPEMMKDSYGFTVHHTGYGGTLFKPDPIQRLRGIQAFHMNDLGYGDIAYEGAFDADGNTFGLRDGHYVGAHALGTKRGGNIPNEYTDGIVYLEDERGWTRGASVALAWWADLFAFVHGRHPHFFAHEYWSLTECPGSYLVDVVKVYGGNV